MYTKYNGQISDENIKDYCNTLVNKIFKLLALRDENDPTRFKYHKSLMYELAGADELLIEDTYFTSLLVNLEYIYLIEDKEDFKSKIFGCISMVKKIPQGRN